MRVTRPYHPHLYGSKIIIRSAYGKRIETTSRVPTYVMQLRAFREAVTTGAPVATGVRGAVTPIRALDKIYLAAGVALRP